MERGAVECLRPPGEPEWKSRLEFLEVGPEDRAALAEVGGLLAPHHELLLDRWYAFLLSRPETRELLGRGRAASHLRGAQAVYFRQLFCGPYDGSYFAGRLRIGFVHEKVGLKPAWYMGSYRKYVEVVHTFLLEKGFGEDRIAPWMRALEKLVCLDMELALDAYFDTFYRGLVDANDALRLMAERLEVRNADLSLQFSRAQEAAATRDELLSRVSHELRTPLNAVIGYSDLLLDGIEGPLSEGQQQSVQIIRRQGDKLLSLIDRMLDTAKMASAGVSAPVLFDAASAAHRVAVSARAAADAKGLAFDVAVDDDLPGALGDETGFALALGHVLENAVQFTPAGRIRLDGHHVGDVVRFTVSDTGDGIPADHAERIFEPFHQVDFGDTRKASGLGIGLPLAKSALDRMGGTLRLASSGPGGSVFELDLAAEPPPSLAH